MKNIILAAGYATRLYPLTENFPKPLLKIGNSTILDRMLDDIDRIDVIDEHIIITNHKFAHIFEEWKDAAAKRLHHAVTIIDDGTSNNETRLGAVNDLLLALGQEPSAVSKSMPSAVSKNKADITYHLRDGEAEGINDDILVAAADNILDFSFKGFVDFANEKNASCIMYYEEPELKNLQRTGVIAIDENHRVLEMQEKPVAPVSNHAVPPFYVYKKKDLPLIRTSIENGCGFDAPGNLAHFLVERTDVYAYQMPGCRFDIGSLDSYESAKNLFE
jgi:glucose-1-phosphate thymidylyltransferase